MGKTILICIFCFLILSCGTAPPQRALYSVAERTTTTIRGTGVMSDILITEYWAPGSVKISVRIQNFLGENVIRVYYESRLTRVEITEFLIRVDDQVFPLKIDSPVFLSDGFTVAGYGDWRANSDFPLDQNLINRIKNCKTLVMQPPYRAPITISEEGIAAIKDFLNKN